MLHYICQDSQTTAYMKYVETMCIYIYIYIYIIYIYIYMYVRVLSFLW